MLRCWGKQAAREAHPGPLCFLQNSRVPPDPKDLGQVESQAGGGSGKPEGKMRTGVLAKKPRPELCRSQPQMGQTFGKDDKSGGSAGRDEFNSFSRGSTGPPVSQATGEVLDSCFLNQSKNHCFSSSGDVLSLSPLPQER